MPTTNWDKVVVYAWYYDALGVAETGQAVEFKIVGAPNGVRRVDGRAIYRAGAAVTTRVGPDDHDVQAREIIRQALRDQAQAAAGVEFDGAAWDTAWSNALPALVCVSFYATDDPDITPQGWQVEVNEKGIAGGKKYPIDLPLATVSQPVPGLNLGMIELPEGTPNAPAPTYAKGQPGGVAALDAEGDVLDGSGNKVLGGEGGTDLTTYEQVSALGDYPTTFPPTTHQHTASQISDATTVGRSVLSAADATAARSAINAASSTHNHSGTYQPVGDYATLVGGVIPTSQIPALALTSTNVVASQAAMLALSNVQAGDIAVRTDGAGTFILSGANPAQIGSWTLLSSPTDAVTSVNGQTGAITLSAANVGAAPTTRTITAGTGLTGGGDLSANRTLAVSYGTTAGTAAQGNDSRLTAVANKVDKVTGASLVYKLQESSDESVLPAGSIWIPVPDGTPGSV